MERLQGGVPRLREALFESIRTGQRGVGCVEGFRRVAVGCDAPPRNTGKLASGNS